MKKREYNENFFSVVKMFDIAFSQNDFYTKYARYKYKEEMMFYYNFKNSKYSIISLCNQKKFNLKLFEIIISKLRKKLENYSSKKSFPILLVFITDKNIQEVKQDTIKKITYLTSNKARIQSEIKKLISEVDFEPEIQISDYLKTQEKLKENKRTMGFSIKSKTYHKLSILRTKSRLLNLPIIFSIIGFCIFLPIIITIFWSGNKSNLNYSSNSVLMIFGALNRDLVIGLNQWWRVFTFPLINNNLISLVINGFIFYFVCRYIEVLLGAKKTLILLSAYPFVGLLFILVSQTAIISGISYIFALFVGAMATTIYKRNDYVAKFAKQSLFLGIFYLLLSFFLTYSLTQTFFILITFIIGTIFGLLFNHNYQKKDIYFYLPIILLFLFIVLIIVLIFLIEFINVVPAYNPDVINTLRKYELWNLISRNSILRFINNYYYINNHYLYFVLGF